MYWQIWKVAFHSQSPAYGSSTVQGRSALNYVDDHHGVKKPAWCIQARGEVSFQT